MKKGKRISGRKVVSVFCVLLLIFGMTSLTTLSASAVSFASGNGTSGSPWVIKTAEQFAKLQEYTGTKGKGKYFKLGNNISLSTYLSKGQVGYNSGKGWRPIGDDVSNGFMGTLNGDGYTLSGFWIADEALFYSGLFGVLSGATINNVHIAIPSGKSVNGYRAVAGLAGMATGGSKITNCSVTGSLKATQNNTWMGAITAQASEGTVVENCYSSGSMTVNANICYVGGLIADLRTDAKIKKSFSSMNISVKGNENRVGGLVGWIQVAAIENAYSTGKITESGSVNRIGGFVGYAAPQNVADMSEVKNCYVAVTISKNGTDDRIGAFVGQTSGFMIVTNSYYDKTLAGSLAASGLGDNGVRALNAVTTAQMKKQSTFANWNFSSIWYVQEGKTYPGFRWSVVTQLTVSPKSTNLLKGEILTITAKTSPTTALDSKVVWTSSNTSVATVDKNTGKVTAKGSGQATITAASGITNARVSITVHNYVTMKIGSKTAIQNGIKTTIDKQGTKPFIFSKRTMVPVRFVAEKMGGKVKYTSDSAPIVITYGDTTIELKLNKTSMTIRKRGQSKKIIQLDVAARKDNGRTFIPLRAVSQALGFSVYYDANTKYIVVNNPKLTSTIRTARLAEAKKRIQ